MRSFKMDEELFAIFVPSLSDVYFVEARGQNSCLRDRNTILSDDVKPNGKHCRVLLSKSYETVPRLKDKFDKSTGFRPCLRLVRKGQDDAPVADGFDDVPNGTLRRMFTMLVDGQPVQVPGPGHGKPLSWFSLKGKNKGKISFTDEYFGERYLLSWVFVNGRAVCTSVVLTEISWNELKRQGYC